MIPDLKQILTPGDNCDIRRGCLQHDARIGPTPTTTTDTADNTCNQKYYTPNCTPNGTSSPVTQYGPVLDI